MKYSSLPVYDEQKQAHLPRVECSTTPNPLSRKFHGPRFLDSGQIIEVRNEKEAFRCSTLLHDLFISSKTTASNESCCSSSNKPSKTGCCQTENPAVSTVADQEESPFRSIYLNEKSLTITLNADYVKDRVGGAREDNIQIEETANKIWEKLTQSLLDTINKRIENLKEEDISNTFTGSIKVLDKTYEPDHSDIATQPLWATAGEDTEITIDDSEPVMAVKELIRQRVKPLLEQDGGSCRFVGMVEEGDSFYADIIKNRPHVISSDAEDPLEEPALEVGSVLLLLEGACVGCPSSSFTLKNGVQRMLTHWVVEVKQVVEVDEEFAKDVLSARQKLKEQKK